MGFQFVNYTTNELRQCGTVFSDYFATAEVTGTGAWTCAVCDWFRATAAPGLRVYPPSSGRKDEFVVDQCHTTYPINDDVRWPSLDWYDEALRRRLRMNLALESEWGKEGAPSANLSSILDDACKLALLRASAKVIIFSSHSKDSPDRIPKKLTMLRAAHGDEDPWLYLDVVNDPSRIERIPRQIRYGIIDGNGSL